LIAARRSGVAFLLAPFLVALALADQAGSSPAVGAAPATSRHILEVPYLAQTRALCGGAAAAMVFRYWGDRHADVQQFAGLVDSRGLGIASDVLVEAIRQRQWTARPFLASIDSVRERLAQKQPLILLLEDRPGRYHYVIAVGADGESIFVHDPTWGPARRYSHDELTRVWKPTNFWALLVLPDETRGAQARSDPSMPSDSAMRTSTLRTDCERLLDTALDEIDSRGLDAADEILAAVREECPAAAAPVAELAAVRFAQKRWKEAEALAELAVDKDPANDYGWDVLGSTRFILNDPHGALRAWNQIGKPRLDSVQINGLSRTRYALVADALALTPNTMLTEAAFLRADRRLQLLPSRSAARMGYRPDEDGFATLDVVVVERDRRPRGLLEWISAGSRAAVQREVRATIPGWSGQGEVWNAAWRWWENRPRVALTFAAPRVAFLRGVSRVEASWEMQTYQGSADAGMRRERRLHGAFVTTDWITANLRYEVAAGIDAWDPRSLATRAAAQQAGTRRTVSIGGLLEHRFLDDRLAIAGGGHAWTAVSGGSGFRSGSLRAAFQSSASTRGFVQLVDAGFMTASEHAPLALWSGAGEGHGRAPLLRAHSLLSGGVVSGPVFGRDVAHLNVESQRWLERPALVRVGFAAFVDIAKAARSFTSHSQAHVDIGGGVRVRAAGDAGVFRCDYAHGIRDGRNAVTVGWLVRP
jgi:hypothetical protein